MARFLTTALLLLSSVSVSLSNREKYSLKKNLPQEPDLSPPSTPFRMNKINVVWQKAQAMLKPGQLDELFAVIGSFDMSFDVECEDNAKLPLCCCPWRIYPPRTMG